MRTKMPTTQNTWTLEDAAALHADLDAYPREIGGSAMLDMILNSEDIRIDWLDDVAAQPAPAHAA